MPELPEVETVVRDLRGLVLGATIVTARTYWNRTLRNAAPVDFAGGVAGRRIEAVGRRGKLIVVELSGGDRPDDPPEDDGPVVRRSG